MISANFKIKFNSKQHVDILRALRDRKELSDKKTNIRHKEWRAAEDNQVGFIKESENDALRRVNRDNLGVQDFTTVHVPYSQAMLLSAHTYWTSVFLNRDPVVQFTARHGESQQKVQAVEAIMNYQTMVGKHTVPYFIWLYDAGKYGLGILGNFWEEETRLVSHIEKRPVTFLGIDTGKTEKIKTTQRIPGYMGSKLFNVRPYDFINDPRVPFSQLQKGEFCGRIVRDFSLNDLIAGEDNDLFFNVDIVKKKMPTRGASDFEEKGSANVTWPAPEEEVSLAGPLSDPGFIDLWEMYVRLIPNEWGVGNGKQPEKWVFTVAKGEVIIGARPLGEFHDQFPFSILEQEIEGYALFKRGITEQQKGLNDVMSWLFNSHFYNVRAAMNNQFIYDPSKILRSDIMDPQPGKRMRLRPDAYGTDVRKVITQLEVQDITRGNLGDIDMVGALMQRAGGITDNIMGLLNAGGRKTATEVRTSSSFAVNRMKTVAEYMSAMGFDPLSSMLLQTTQQHYDTDRQFKIAGDISSTAPFMGVTPEDIAGFYDFVPVDGTLPIDRFAQANLWKEILLGMQGMPEIAAQYDLAGIFTWMAQLSGMKNIKQFRVQVGDDENLQAEVQKGNLVPIDGRPKQLPNIGSTSNV